MSERLVVRDQILECQNRIDHALRGLDDAVLESDPAVGSWPPSVVAAHLASWMQLSLAVGQAVIDEQPQPQQLSDGQSFNEAQAAAATQRSWEQNNHLLHTQVELVGGFLSEIRDEDWDMGATYPWGEVGTLAGLFEGMAEHHDEHCRELQHWRARYDS